MARGYVQASGVKKRGSCHILRHACATAMLEGGADIRFIQAMLGHSNLRATEIYTQVSIRKLKDIHTATHPGAALKRPDAKAKPDDAEEREAEVALLDALAEEAQEEPDQPS